jgi:lipopolysaccharide export system protein LptA
MSRLLFILFSFSIIFFAYFIESSATLAEKNEKKPIIITSRTLTADNKNNTAVFEGNVVAKTGDITIYSDRMTVFYDNSQSTIKKIEASGNVKVQRKERVIFSDEAIFIDNEKKIIFRGNPRAVEGENIITGTQIIFFLQDDRAVVEGSRVILQNKQAPK